MSHEGNDFVLERYYEDLQELGFFSEGAAKLAHKALEEDVAISSNEIPFLKDAKSIDSMSWEDTGCEVSNSCLNCPLPICKHDDYKWYESYYNLSKYKPLLDDLLVEDDSPNITEKVKRLSIKYDISTRQVFRLKKKFFEGEFNLDMVTLFYNNLNALEEPKNGDS